MRYGWDTAIKYTHSASCRLRFRKIFLESDTEKHRVEDSERRQNRWLAEQVQEADVPAKGGDNELPSINGPPQSFHPPGDDDDDKDRSSEMYAGTDPGDDDNMDAFTEDMDTKSVGMVLKALGHEQAGAVR